MLFRSNQCSRHEKSTSMRIVIVCNSRRRNAHDAICLAVVDGIRRPCVGRPSGGSRAALEVEADKTDGGGSPLRSSSLPTAGCWLADSAITPAYGNLRVKTPSLSKDRGRTCRPRLRLPPMGRHSLVLSMYRGAASLLSISRNRNRPSSSRLLTTCRRVGDRKSVV